MIAVMTDLIRRRRRTAALVAAWLAGTVLVVVVGIRAVAVVSDSVTEARPAPLSAAAVNQALTQEREQTPPPTVPTTGTTRATTGATPATTRPTATTTTTRPRAPVTTTTTNPTVTTAPPATTGTTTTGAAEDRTYDLTGGSVGVRFQNGTARLLWATPAAGFRAESHGGGDEVDIRFRSDTHESRLRAFWHDGPQAEVEEQPRS
jgi:cytoskeletal protein RodZ